MEVTMEWLLIAYVVVTTMPEIEPSMFRHELATYSKAHDCISSARELKENIERPNVEIPESAGIQKIYIQCRKVWRA